jgi:hypothetical protein
MVCQVHWSTCQNSVCCKKDVCLVGWGVAAAQLHFGCSRAIMLLENALGCIPSMLLYDQEYILSALPPWLWSVYQSAQNRHVTAFPLLASCNWRYGWHWSQRWSSDEDQGATAGAAEAQLDQHGLAVGTKECKHARPCGQPLRRQ